MIYHHLYAPLPGGKYCHLMPRANKHRDKDPSGGIRTVAPPVRIDT